MAETTSLNSQALEATALIDTLVTGLTPSAAFAILDGVMAETLGLAMHNAVARQQSGGTIAAAAVSAACARIAASQAPPPLFEPPPPPGLAPLPTKPETAS